MYSVLSGLCLTVLRTSIILCLELPSTFCCCLDPHKLGIRCRLNGEVVQNSNTTQLVHKTEALVSYLSRLVVNNAPLVKQGTKGFPFSASLLLLVVVFFPRERMLITYLVIKSQKVAVS